MIPSVLGYAGVEIEPIESEPELLAHLLRSPQNCEMLGATLTGSAMARAFFDRMSNELWSSPMRIRAGGAQGLLLNADTDPSSLNTRVICLADNGVTAVGVAISLFARHLFWSFPLHRLYTYLPASAVEMSNAFVAGGFQPRGPAPRTCAYRRPTGGCRSARVAAAGLRCLDSEQRRRPGPSGRHVISDQAITGRRVELRPVSADDMELRRLDDERRVGARTSGSFQRTDEVGNGLPGPYLIVDRKTGAAIGVIASDRPSEHAPAELTCFVDPALNLPGWGLEAYVLYARALRDAGETRLRLGVLGGDRTVRRMLRALGQDPTAWLREHEWSAGEFHDVLIFDFTESSHDAIDSRLSGLLKLDGVRSGRAGVP